MWLWQILANINYALFDLLLAGIIAYSIEKKTAFKKTEIFVGLTLVLGTISYLISNKYQETIVRYMEENFSYWLLFIFLGITSIYTIFLCRAEKGRTWKFRLIVISIIAIAILILAGLVIILSSRATQ